ncbi:MAG: AMP-binding protein [Pseudonocardiales bacterium]|nr:AMP-binding protein [Pseudonocardiales bacterium]
MIETTLPERLDRLTKHTAPAVFDGDRWFTWADCHAQAEIVARALYHRASIRAGDVVAIQLPNSWELIVLHAATARLGAVLLPLHMAYGTHEVRSLINQTAAKLLVIRDSHRQRDRSTQILSLSATAGPLRHVWISGNTPDTPRSYAHLLREAPCLPAAPRFTPLPHSPLMLLVSSGTTSQHPKMCIHTHASLLGNAAAVIADSGFNATETIVSASPFSHAFGILSLHMALLTGAAVGLLPAWDPATFLHVLRTCRATTAFAVPAQLRDLLRAICESGTAAPAELREIRTGGAAVAADLVSMLHAEVGAHITVQWGMSELGAGTYTRSSDPPKAALSTIGRPITGASARIMRPDGNPAGLGEAGEFQFRSPFIFGGYLNDPQLTKAAFTDDGWFRTGDLAWANPDGSFSYWGRADDLINRGGMKFTGAEIEQLLADIPDIDQLAVMGRPDVRLGQRSCLVVSLRPGGTLTLHTVTNHLKDKDLATYKFPEELVVLDSLPTTPTGKVSRARLRTMLQAASTPKLI